MDERPGADDLHAYLRDDEQVPLPEIVCLDIVDIRVASSVNISPVLAKSCQDQLPRNSLILCRKYRIWIFMAAGLIAAPGSLIDASSPGAYASQHDLRIRELTLARLYPS